MTEEEFKLFIAAGDWTFAKTMPHHPHEYVVSGRHVTGKIGTIVYMKSVYEFIKQNGYMAWFYGKIPIYYYDLDGHCYWRGDDREPEEQWRVFLLNRAKLPNMSIRRDDDEFPQQRELDL